MVDLMIHHPKNSDGSIDDRISELATQKKALADYLLDWIRDLK